MKFSGIHKSAVHPWVAASLIYGAFGLGILGLAGTAEALPPVPPEGTPTCEANVGGVCFVSGPFNITTFSSGATHYRVCRSDDGGSGCDFTIETQAQMPFLIESAHIPNDGHTRAYKFRACDGPSSCTPWSESEPAFVTTDASAPSAPGLVTVNGCAVGTSGNDCWVSGAFTISSSAASDAGSGVAYYEFCRSHDNNGGFAGCNSRWATGPTPSILVDGGNLPTEGNRRAYRIRAYDHMGFIGDWATPRYVRVDYRDPWLTIQGPAAGNELTYSAGDDLGGATANSGLDEVRFRWNQPLDSACTTGSLWLQGPITIPAGENTLYACARDLTGRVIQVQETYDVDDLPPTTEHAWVSSPTWTVNRTQEYDIHVEAFDDLGLEEIRAAINYGTFDLRGIFSWRTDAAGSAWWKDRMQCAGGGWGSMNRNQEGSRVTLTGCQTALDPDGFRSVTFTVRPNESFGVFNQRHDISARAWDLNGNSSSWDHYDTNFSSVRPGDQPGTGYGYQGILDIPSFNQSVQAGIPVNVTSLLYTAQQYLCTAECQANPAECKANPSYWQTTDTAGIMDVYEQNNAKAMVIMENFLFQNELRTVGDSCEALSPPPSGPDACSLETGQRWRLRPDWQSRLDTFVSLHGAELNSQNVAFLLMTSEINDRCFDAAEVETAAQAVRIRFPGLKLGMIYGATYDSNHVLDSQPAPSSFPSIFDVIGLFSYRNLDVNNPAESKNAAADRFYNPEIPGDGSTIYGDLLGKLHPHQEVLLVFDMNLSGQHTNLGWVEDDFGTALLNYADFMSYRPEVTTLGGFTFSHLLQRSQGVRDVAAAVGCEYFLNGSPLCF